MREEKQEEALFSLLRERRSVREFKDEPLPRELLEKVLDAAILAPSASNKQPWRFFVMEGRVKIRALAAEVRREKERIGSHIPADFAPSFLAYGDYFTRFESAPVVIAPAARPLAVLSNLVSDALDEKTRKAISRMEEESGLIGTSLAIGNLLLCAHAIGLGASAMTGPMIARAQVTEAFGVPDGWSVVALVALGYPALVPTKTERKDAKSVTRYVK